MKNIKIDDNIINNLSYVKTYLSNCEVKIYQRNYSFEIGIRNKKFSDKFDTVCFKTSINNNTYWYNTYYNLYVMLPDESVKKVRGVNFESLFGILTKPAYEYVEKYINDLAEVLENYIETEKLLNQI